MKNSKRNSFTCPRCGVGRCQPTTTTFVDVYADQLLSIPNVAANICDVCYFAEFDQSAIELLWSEIELDDFADDFVPSKGQEQSSTFGE